MKPMCLCRVVCQFSSIQRDYNIIDMDIIAQKMLKELFEIPHTKINYNKLALIQLKIWAFQELVVMRATQTHNLYYMVS